MDLGSELAQVYLLRGRKPAPDGIIRWSPGTNTSGLGGVVRINSTFFGIKRYLDVEILDVMNELFYALPSGTIIRGYKVDSDGKIEEIKKTNV